MKNGTYPDTMEPMRIVDVGCILVVTRCIRLILIECDIFIEPLVLCIYFHYALLRVLPFCAFSLISSRTLLFLTRCMILCIAIVHFPLISYIAFLSSPLSLSLSYSLSLSLSLSLPLSLKYWLRGLQDSM